MARTDEPMPIRRSRAVALAALFGASSVLGVAACSDEDGDGGTTDEEIQDGKDTVSTVEDEIQQEIDAQDEGSNEDGE